MSHSGAAENNIRRFCPDANEVVGTYSSAVRAGGVNRIQCCELFESAGGNYSYCQGWGGVFRPPSTPRKNYFRRKTVSVVVSVGLGNPCAVLLVDAR